MRLSPLTTLLAGRVVAPIEVEGPLSVAIYPLDETTRDPEYQYLHQVQYQYYHDQMEVEEMVEALWQFVLLQQ